MAVFTIGEVDGIGSASLGHFDNGLTVFEFDSAYDAYTWGASGLPDYINALSGNNLDFTNGTGTVTAWRLYAPDGTTVVASVTGVSVPLDHFLSGTTAFDPSLGDYQTLWGLSNLLLGDDTITGSEFADHLGGVSGNDTMNGNGGDDHLSGMAGDDIIDGGEGNDQLSGGNGNDEISGGIGNDIIWGGDAFTSAPGYVYVPAFDTIDGGDGDDEIFAQAGWNFPGGEYFYAGGGKIDGGLGTDILYANFSHLSSNALLDLRDPTIQQDFSDGSYIVDIERVYLSLGSGNDTVYDGLLADQIWTGGGDDTVYFGGGVNSILHLGDGDDTFHWGSVEGSFTHGLTGGDGYDILIIDWSGLDASPQSSFDGSFEEVRYIGTEGADGIASSAVAQLTLAYGMGGNDVFQGTGTNDLLDGGEGDDDLAGNGGNDRLFGQAGADELFGGAGDDTLIGGAGADYLGGDDDIDTADYSASGSRVGVNLTTGQGLGGDAHGDTLTGIENLVGTNAARGDILTGNAEANRFQGLAGADQVNGMGGVDTADYSASASHISVNLTTGQGLGGDADGDALTSIENLVGTNAAFSDILTGNAAANRLEGLAGDDQLAGLGGADALLGGAGVDTADYSASASRINVNLTTGVGLGGDAHGDTLTGIENLVGTNAARGDILTGDAEANWFYGLAGGDQINGMGGIDTADYWHSGSRVSVNLTTGQGLGGDAHGDTLTSIEILIGTNAARGDFLTGDAEENWFYGLAGGDQINGMGGTDTADYWHSVSRVSVNLTTGAGLGGDAHGDTLTGIENLVGTNAARGDFLTGDAEANWFHGLAGGDQINGMGGIDTADYWHSASRINVNLTTGQGLGGDAHGDVLTGIENLVGTNAANADFLTGNAAANQIEGLVGSDQINGMGGDDLLVGGSDGDTFVFSGVFGTDIIGDFEDDLDHILFQGAGSLTGSSNVGGNAVYTFDTGSQLTVSAMTVALLADDITFA